MLTMEDIDAGFSGDRTEPDFRLFLTEHGDPEFYQAMCRLKPDDLEYIQESDKAKIAAAQENWDAKEPDSLIWGLPDRFAILFVRMNYKALRNAGMLEPALYQAWIGANLLMPSGINRETMRELFYDVDRARLRQCGESLPSSDNVTIYRGVPDYSEKGSHLGLGWTLHPGIAVWYAKEAHYRTRRTSNPSVYRITVAPDDPRILFYTNGRKEKEVVFMLAGSEKKPNTVLPLPKMVDPNSV